MWRKLDGETSFTQLGSVVAKTFVDTSIVVGTSAATYYVVATRTGGSSPASEQLTISFAAVEAPGQTLKLAA
ncbi:MAG TPA: hypothetical protein VJ835_08445 [Fimbriimonadaceae bacterium]|nr:hypothetical protein [Fimbriimonadaceae bacterium]